MTTIPNIMGKISSDIQNATGELLKLLLTKTLRQKFSVNNYSYILTNDCLGWTYNAVTNFKLFAKFIKNNKARRKVPVAYSPREKVAYETLVIANDTKTLAQRNFLEILTAENMQNLIVNNRGGITFTCDVLYTDCWKELDSIGEDILKQSNPEIRPEVSAKLSTAQLRIKLYQLEQDLEILAVKYPSIFDAYLNMMVLINSVQRTQINWVVALIGHLSFIRWENLTPSMQNTFIIKLGQEFIDSFISNELITILLQSGFGETILTASYLYSLLKMLFIVFGYNEFIPHIVSHPCPGDSPINASSCSSPADERCLTTPRCIIGKIDAFQDLYPTINEIISGLEILPPLSCKKIACDTLTPNYNCLYTISELLWKFSEYSYCQYRDYTDSKIIANNIRASINSKIFFMETF